MAAASRGESSAASITRCCDLPAVGGCPLVAAKKKGCKRKKCSNWKGGKCRCGRD